jgi:hypothetical protein
MQTFLPFTDFSKVAKTLDSKRLNKQILEGYQILKALSAEDPKTSWRNHPASRMWSGHEYGLLDYIFAMVDEANLRNIRTEKNVSNLKELREVSGKSWGAGRPEWFSNRSFIDRVVTTHKANLFRKDSEFYAAFASAVDNINNVPCCDTCSYFWVTHALKKV